MEKLKCVWLRDIDRGRLEGYMDVVMKKIGISMGIYMSLIMSFFLALTGMGASGHFNIPGFIVSFLVSFMISLVISFLVPMGKVNKSLEMKHNLRPGALKTRGIEALVSNLIYTPILTLCMVTLAYFKAKNASGNGEGIPFIPAFLKSLGLCFIVGYILIFIFQDLIMKHLFKKYKINPGEGAKQSE